MQKIRFVLIVFFKAITILFRRQQKLKVLRCEYNQDYTFEQSFLVLNLEVKNALYFKLGSCRFLDGGIKIFTRQFLEPSLTLTIYGLFGKQILDISNKPTLSLDAKPFMTTISHLSPDLGVRAIKNLKTPQIQLRLTTATFSKQDIHINCRPVPKVLLNSYKQEDYL